MKKQVLLTMAVFSVAALLCTGCRDRNPSQVSADPTGTVTEALTPTDITDGTTNTPTDIPGDHSNIPNGNLLPSDAPGNENNSGTTGNTPDVDLLPTGDPGTAPDETLPPTNDSGSTVTLQPTDSHDITPTEEITMAPTDIDSAFYISPITDEIFARIKGKSYPEGCTLSLDEIRYIHVLHYDFEGNISEGEIIVNTAVAEDVLEIFRELFDIEYPIEKMTLIDAYDADDERSMEDNNTSAFNYRFIAETTVLSNHALGLAIDINPLYNPYVYVRSDGSTFLQPYNAGDYVDRAKDNPYYIRRNDECYNIFISHGFTWGGDWNTKKDYQHFEKKTK